jgi:nucleoside-diphosphate-sugar epimerase
MDVVRAIEALLGQASTFGQVYNLCQRETPTLADLLAQVARSCGAPLRLVPIPRGELEAAGLDPVAVSPFSGLWMSFLDATRAEAEIAFRPEPLERSLEKIVAAVLSHWPAEPPPGYAGRTRERALIRDRVRSGEGSTTPPPG